MGPSDSHVPSYAVFWRELNGAVYAGELTLRRDRLRLEGSGRAGAGAGEVRYRDIANVRVGRAGRERIDGRPALVIERRNGSRVLVTSTVGLGMNHEIAERLAGLMAGALV